jgi:DNA polymerase-4
MERSILCLDIPAFPVAVERVVDPALRGRPVIVAPPGSARALVIAVSDEASREGVRPGMPVPAAMRRCPGVILRPADDDLYRRAAGAVLGLLGGFTPLVEPFAPGRAFLDLTGTGRLFGSAPDAAVRIRREVADRLRLRATAGVATNKLVSRVAARVIRPDGLYDVFPGAEAAFLAPLPVRLLPGAAMAVGAIRFEDLGIAQVGDLLSLTLAQVRMAFGWRGESLLRQASGLDEAPVRPPALAPVVAADETLAEPTNEEQVLLRVLLDLCERIGARLRRLRTGTRRLRLTLRHVDGVMAHGERDLPSPAAADVALFERARALLQRARARRVAVRWLELRALALDRGPRQLDLFGVAGGADRLTGAIDDLRGRFGPGAVVWGRRLGAPPSSSGTRARRP